MYVIDVQGGNKEKSDATQMSKGQTTITQTSKLEVVKENTMSSAASERQSAGMVVGNSQGANNRNRPHTAGSGSSSVHLDKGVLSSRPNTAGDRAKSVRFADDSSVEGSIKELKDMKNEMIISEQKSGERKKTESKSTCKPSEESSDRKKDDDNDKNDNSKSDNRNNRSSNLDRTSTANNASSSEKESNTGGGGSSGKQHVIESVYGDRLVENLDLSSLKSRLEDVKLTPKDKTPRKSRCLKSANDQPNVLSVGSVLHGGQVHHFIGPESPHRSRSPSPSRSISPCRRSSSPNLVQAASHDSRRVKGQGSLVRPSSAHKSGRTSNRNSRSRSSRSNSLQSDSGDSSTPRKSKVYFEGERKPHSSVFVETESESGYDVELKEERTLTFDEIESELLALRQDIKDRRVTEELEKIMIDDNDEKDSVEEVTTDLISLPTHDASVEEVSDIEADTLCDGQNEKDYMALLDVYRRKCMEVSETCGEISDKFTSPRKSRITETRPQSGRNSRLTKRRNSYHFEDFEQRGKDGRESGAMNSKDDHCTVVQAGSQLSLATDSGCSMGSTETLKGEQDSETSPNKVVGENSIASRKLESEKFKDDEDVGGKSLLEFVCEELPPVEKVTIIH